MVGIEDVFAVGQHGGCSRFGSIHALCQHYSAQRRMRFWSLSVEFAAFAGYVPHQQCSVARLVMLAIVDL